LASEFHPLDAIAKLQHQIRLLIKTLYPPVIDVDEMLEAMQHVYSTADILVDEGPREDLEIGPDREAPQLDFDVGRCRAGEVTDEQRLLFEYRAGADPDDIVIYLVRTTIPPTNGCAAFPSGRPGAIVASGASPVTLAHEVGHVLGLPHVNDKQNLMTSHGTATIVGEPVLTDEQISTMHNSPYCTRNP
jgi:hypothetical protein